MALQVKTVGLVFENTECRATPDAASRSPALIRDCTLLCRFNLGPTSAEVESGSRGAFGSRCGGGWDGSLRSAWRGGSIRRRRLRRRRSAAASSADEKAKPRRVVWWVWFWLWRRRSGVKVWDEVVVVVDGRRRERRRMR